MSAPSQPQNAPLPTQSVGIVERQTATLFVDPPLTLASGQTIGPVAVEYETCGQLNENRDNGIFVCHALTGDAHVAGIHQPDDPKEVQYLQEMNYLWIKKKASERCWDL